MAFTHTITEQVVTGGRTIAQAHAHTGGSQQSINEPVPDGSTDLLVGFTLDVSQVKSFYIVSDHAITIDTNDWTTPDDTLTLAAGVPYIWHENSPDTFKLTTDVTALYVTNASGSAATLDIETVTDPTV